MMIRDATTADFEEVAKTSISRGVSKIPDWTSASYALEDNKTVLAVGGIILVNPTTAWFWFNMSDAARGRMIVVYRAVKEWLDKLMEIHGVKRCMASVDCSFAEAVRTVEHLGFHQESIMEKFFDGSPGFMFVKFRGDE